MFIFEKLDLFYRFLLEFSKINLLKSDIFKGFLSLFELSLQLLYLLQGFYLKLFLLIDDMMILFKLSG